VFLEPKKERDSFEEPPSFLVVQPPSTPTRFSQGNWNHPLFQHHKGEPPKPLTMRSPGTEQPRQHHHQHYWPQQPYPQLYPHYAHAAQPSSSGGGAVAVVFAVVLMVFMALALATCGGCVMLTAVSDAPPATDPASE